MKSWGSLGLALATLTASARADLLLARDGHTSYLIVHAVDASPAEVGAARELATNLEAITGCAFPMQGLQAEDRLPRQAILVGRSPAAEALFPGIPWSALGPEEVVLGTRGRRLLVAGGGPRGALYAVSRFLQDQCGVRWWTPWASRVPRRAELRIPELSVRSAPAFEARDPFWYSAFDPRWAVRNFSNSQHAHIPPELGGGIVYKGFVHTFYALVPPEKHFAEHPEWYSLVKGTRSHDHAQLCLTNPGLRDFVVERVREWLRESPDARIVSISQNDWHGACQCDACKALDEAEGSHSGTMLAFVNDVAERLGTEFPEVAFDTLAYQYTRKPPKTLRPRTNVIVRLCSIECNFREPLESPANAAFADDIRGWSRICDRLYVWDYTTDFAHYVQPHPNWYVLGPNLRFFRAHHVRGVFEQGAYQSYGADMAELRAWVLAQLLWNPEQDDRALLREFVEGYYGRSAAPFILRYLDLMHEASAGCNLTCFSGTNVPFLKYPSLAAAEALWREAERASAGEADENLRVRMSHRSLGYVWLARWDSLRTEYTGTGGAWPVAETRQVFAREFKELADGVDGAPWTRITHLNEGGRTPAAFVAPFLESGPAAAGSE